MAPVTLGHFDLYKAAQNPYSHSQNYKHLEGKKNPWSTDQFLVGTFQSVHLRPGQYADTQ